MNLLPEDAGSSAVAAMRVLADGQDLRRLAEVRCLACLRNAAAEGDTNGLVPEDVRTVFERCALVFAHGQLNYAFVETRLGLRVDEPARTLDGLKPIGHYRLITRLDGTIEDDYLVLD